MATDTQFAVVTPSSVERIARISTEVAQPPLVLSLLLVLAAMRDGGGVTALLPGLVAAVTICLAPLLVVVILARRGKLTDHHVGDKKQRRPVMLWTLASALVGCGILTLIDTPVTVWALIAGILGGILALIIVSPFWKVSGHAMTLGGATVSSAMLFGVWSIPFVIAAPLVCWSRVYLKDHTLSQVITGFVTGLIVFGSACVLILN
ncbi:phosphatase PAP2 family protein [Pseudarthrobacter sp. NPDC058119]|uniref:phosphatase PAP2 family protein n=1 Tax=Pseudarthrobacter sp. NPDC058119 TaxID=3346348 RepID=UPI0036DF2B22